MKQIVISALLFSVIGCQQKTTNNADTDKKETTATPVVKTNAKTPAHVQIPGSELYIIPPAGFKENKVTMQLEKEKGYANFMRMQIIMGYTPEKYFADLKADADKKSPGSWKQEDIIADGHKATIYQYKIPGVIQYYLAFTDEYSADMMIANFEEKDTATGKAMYEAMKTVVVQK